MGRCHSQAAGSPKNAPHVEIGKIHRFHHPPHSMIFGVQPCEVEFSRFFFSPPTTASTTSSAATPSHSTPRKLWCSLWLLDLVHAAKVAKWPKIDLVDEGNPFIFLLFLYFFKGYLGAHVLVFFFLKFPREWLLIPRNPSIQG